ncbi:MAG: hypothetical protein ACPL1F_00260 [bacterium]
MANNINTGIYRSNDIFFGNYEVNYKFYDLQNKKWSVWYSIGYTDAEVSLTPTVDYAEFKALVPQITIANNISGYLQELRFTVAEIMLNKMAKLLGGQSVVNENGGQQTFNYTWNESSTSANDANIVMKNDFKQVLGAPDNTSTGPLRYKLLGQPIDSSLVITSNSGGTPTNITSMFRIDHINGEYYLTLVDETNFNALTPDSIDLTYNYVLPPIQRIGLIDDPSILLRYFAFAVIGKNNNAGDGRWVVWFIPRAQMNGMPTLRFAPNDYPKYEMSFKALANIQDGVSPFDTQASLNLVQIFEIPATQVISGNPQPITRSMILNTLASKLPII